MKMNVDTTYLRARDFELIMKVIKATGAARDSKVSAAIETSDLAEKKFY